jgi:hypothetical protein
MKMKNRNQKKTNGASHAGDRVDLRAQIEKRAYDLWLADSCRDGNHLNHWLQAEREMVNMNES